MVLVSILPHAEVGPNDHWEYAPHFNKNDSKLTEPARLEELQESLCRMQPL